MDPEIAVIPPHIIANFYSHVKHFSCRNFLHFTAHSALLLKKTEIILTFTITQTHTHTQTVTLPLISSEDTALDYSENKRTKIIYTDTTPHTGSHLNIGSPQTGMNITVDMGQMNAQTL